MIKINVVGYTHKTLKAMREKILSISQYLLVISCFGHLLCCGFPAVATIINLIAVAGLTGYNLDYFAFLHDYHIHMIIFSAVMLLIGAAAQYMANQIDCHDTGCTHPPCEPQKARYSKVLLLSALLFVVNISVFFFSGHYHEHHASGNHSHSHGHAH